MLRASTAGAIGKALYNELRLQWRAEQIAFAPTSTAPAVLVLNAFDAGGAQLAGTHGMHLFTLEDDLDIAIGRHAIRTGVLLDAGRYRTDERRNTGGTFTFASLDDFAAARPTTFTRNIGDPALAISQVQLGLYVQDDMRVRKDLTISAGVRQEFQTHIGGLHLAPRGGIAWSPFKSGKTTFAHGASPRLDGRALYEQGVQLDGHQRIETILQPGTPLPRSRAGADSSGWPRAVCERPTQPRLLETIAGGSRRCRRVRRTRCIGGKARTAARRQRERAAPNGLRPDPSSGTVTDIRRWRARN